MMSLRYLLYEPSEAPHPSAPDAVGTTPALSGKTDETGLVPTETQSGVRALFPLIIFLHGVGERGDNLELVKKWGVPKHLETGGRLPAYAAAPQCPDTVWWGDVVADLDALLDSLLASHPIDPNRVTLTGFSMGGFGTWQWALASPARFAAIAPVAGTGYQRGDWEMRGDFGALTMPIWAIHSAADQAVAVEPADEVVAHMRMRGANIRYTRYDDADHGQTSDRTFYDNALYEWLLAQQRVAR